MSDKLTAEGFGVGIDVEGQLREDGNPDIVWTNNEVVVSAVGYHDTPHKAVADEMCFGVACVTCSDDLFHGGVRSWMVAEEDVGRDSVRGSSLGLWELEVVGGVLCCFDRDAGHFGRFGK